MKQATPTLYFVSVQLALIKSNFAFYARGMIAKIVKTQSSEKIAINKIIISIGSITYLTKNEATNEFKIFVKH